MKEFYKKRKLENKEKKMKKLEELEVIPLKYKFKKLKHLMSSSSVLNGYKFQFKGRFTRKQKAANLWFSQGAAPLSAMSENVDFSFFTIILDYGACTVKVWLYKGEKAPYYLYRFN